MMATFFGLLSSEGILWLQLAIFIWQAIRPVGTMRLPWALLSTAVYKIFRGKEFDNEHFILLSTDYNDTDDSASFCENYDEGHYTENNVGESIIFSYRDCHYISESQKASQVRLLIIGELKNVPIVKEYKVVNGFMGVWTLCSADEAIRMCLANVRFLVFYLLSNFDNRYLPCSISDFKVKTKKTSVFYTTDNTVLDCRLNGISQKTFDKPKKFSFQAKSFRVEINIKPSDDELVNFNLKLRDVLLDWVEATYTMTKDNFKTYIGCWRLLEKDCVGLVQTVEKGMPFKSMHLFGFEETINLFWGSKVNFYEVELEEEHRYLIAGENHKHYINFDKMESPLYLAIARKWGCGRAAIKP